MAQVPIMDFRGSKFVNEDGTLTDVAQSFFDLLTTVLIKNIGQEGIIVPSQSATNITTIQNNMTTNILLSNSYTCQFGTLLYDNTNNFLKVALNNGSNIPIFKTITTS